MRSPREFLSGEFLKVKYTRRLSTEYPPELWQVPGPIESTGLPMELAENWQPCSRIIRSKTGVGLC